MFRSRTAWLMHMVDCSSYRMATERRLTEISQDVSELRTDVKNLDSRLEDRMNEIASERVVQHMQNLASLRWQRGLLISILLAIMAFVGEQAWTKIFH